MTATASPPAASAPSLSPDRHAAWVEPPGLWRALWPALAVAAFTVAGTIGASQGQPESRDLDAFAFVLVLATPAALVWRRTHPPVALGVGLVATVMYLALDYPKGPIFLGVALAYVNAVLTGWRRLAWAVLAAAYVLVAWVLPAFDDGPWPEWALVGGLGAWLLVLASATEWHRARLERANERRAAEAEETRRRASEERLRIARELHDVLAHDISLISVRAGVALHLVDSQGEDADPAQVRDALAAIKEASRDALGELRSVLDILRQGEDAAPLAPTVGLDDLDRIVEGARGTGLDVRLERVDGDGRPLSEAAVTDGLPAGIDLAAYRIAQEALTNVVRHAEATRVTLRVRRTHAAIEVQVDDDGVGAPPGATVHGLDEREASGRGLAGMRERALALGGTADAGPRPGRGFRVRARLPLPAAKPGVAATGSDDDPRPTADRASTVDRTTA